MRASHILQQMSIVQLVSARLQLLPGARRLPVAFVSAPSTVQAADAAGTGAKQRMWKHARPKLAVWGSAAAAEKAVIASVKRM